MIRTFIYHLLASLAIVFQSTYAQAPDTGEPTAPSRMQVHELKMTSLSRSRTIRVYLPPSYHRSTKSYPVLYLHDGQNLFENATSFAGEWEVDESLDALAKEHGLEVIAVGIDHGGDRRIHEMNPYEHPKYGPAEGTAYLDFIHSEVKPFIDTTYRSLPGRENTALMGSSLGGLITHFALLTHAHAFSKYGLFSPSYWFAPRLRSAVAEAPIDVKTRIYMLVGGKEEGMVEPAEAMHTLLLEKGMPPDQLRYVMDPEGEHREAFWKSYFQKAVAWLFNVPSGD